MSTRHVMTGQQLVPSGQQVRKKLKASRKMAGFKMKPGYLYTVVRAISARVNQNYDGWPSDELKKAAHTFVGKPVFVNHENENPKHARGVVVAARYVEKGADKYIECIQEIDANRFPKLAHEIKSGGLDSVSMGAEAGFTICSYCGNKAVDEPDFCDHVKHHKGATLPRWNRRTGRKEDVLVYESCHKLGFFELSYVFDPADETSVATKVLVANVAPKLKSRRVQERFVDEVQKLGKAAERADKAKIGFQSAVLAAAGYPTSGTAREVEVREQPQSVKDRDGFEAAVLRTAGIRVAVSDCPPGINCERGVPDGSNGEKANPSGGSGGGPNPAAPAATPGVSAPSSGGGGDPGKPDAQNVLPISRPLYDQIKKQYPDMNIGTYRVDSYHEHDHGALDVMTSDPTIAADVRSKAFAAGSPYVLWQQKQWNSDGSTSPMEDRGSPTENHMDHVHTAPPASKPQAQQPQQPQSQMVTPKLTFKAQVLEAAGIPAPENSQYTQRPGTMGTYNKAHKYFDAVGAPHDKGTGGVLDYGAGYGHSSQFGHTYEPHPRTGYEPTYTDPDTIPEGSYHRVTNLNVLNVVPPNIRDQIVDGIGRAMAPSGHAVITTRGRDVWDAADQTPVKGDDGPYGPAVIVNRGKKNETYQKGFHPDELHRYVSDRLGDGFTVKKVPLGPAGVHIIKNAGRTASFEQEVLKVAGYTEAGAHSRSDEGGRHRDDRPWLDRITDRTPQDGLQVSDAKDWLKANPAPPEEDKLFVAKVKAAAGIKQAWGEVEAPSPIDTLREEGTAPDDDTSDFEHYVEPPDVLKMPDLSQAAQIDREQEEQGVSPEQGAGGPPGGPQEDEGQFITLKVPLAPSTPPPGTPPQSFSAPVPGPPQAPMAPQPPAPPPPQEQQPPPPQQQMAKYFRSYYGHQVDTTLGNEHEVHTSNRNLSKGATMGNTLVDRGKVASQGRQRHYADTSGRVDGGDRSRNDLGEQEEAFINSVYGEGVPPEEPVVVPDGTDITNTENNLVAKVQAGREQLLRDAKQLAAVRGRKQGRRRTAEEVAEVVNPTVQTGPAGEALTGDDFESANPNSSATETQPKDASLHAFVTFDKWLTANSGYRSKDLKEAAIKRAAQEYAVRTGIPVQGMFPALGIVLREARKNEAAIKRAAKGKRKAAAPMRKRADEKLEVAAPDDRIDVERPTSGDTDEEAQASQYDLHDYGNNAGDNLADPDLKTDQNWAPGDGKKSARQPRKADGILAMQCAEAMIEAGIADVDPRNRAAKYQLARQFEGMNRGLVLDRIAMAEKFVQVRLADHQHYAQKVASGSTRGATRSPVPLGLTQGVARTASTRQAATNDPTNDYTMFG